MIISGEETRKIREHDGEKVEGRPLGTELLEWGRSLMGELQVETQNMSKIEREKASTRR